jgi:hypothetical protein
LTVMTKQVSTTLAPLLGLTAQFPSPKRGFQDQKDPFFRKGDICPGGPPSLDENEIKVLPLGSTGISRFLATMGRSDSRPERQSGLWIPHFPWTRTCCCPVRSAWSPRFLDDSSDTCRFQPPRTARRHAPVIPWRR